MGVGWSGIAGGWGGDVVSHYPITGGACAGLYTSKLLIVDSRSWQPDITFSCIYLYANLALCNSKNCSAQILGPNYNLVCYWFLGRTDRNGQTSRYWCKVQSIGQELCWDYTWLKVPPIGRLITCSLLQRLLSVTDPQTWGIISLSQSDSLDVCCLSVSLYDCLYVCVSVCLCVCLSVCLSDCLSELPSDPSICRLFLSEVDECVEMIPVALIYRIRLGSWISFALVKRWVTGVTKVVTTQGRYCCLRLQWLDDAKQYIQRHKRCDRQRREWVATVKV